MTVRISLGVLTRQCSAIKGVGVFCASVFLSFCLSVFLSCLRCGSARKRGQKSKYLLSLKRYRGAIKKYFTLFTKKASNLVYK
jgi:hypothetical protein